MTLLLISHDFEDTYYHTTDDPEVIAWIDAVESRQRVTRMMPPTAMIEAAARAGADFYEVGVEFDAGWNPDETTAQDAVRAVEEAGGLLFTSNDDAMLFATSMMTEHEGLSETLDACADKPRIIEGILIT